MFIPIGTENAMRRPTVVTWWLIGLCTAIYLLDEASGPLGMTAVRQALDAMVLNPNAGLFEWWQPVTYLFLHGSPAHLIFNIIFLYVFGPPVEDKFRRLPFLAFYILAGAMAGAVHWLFEHHTIPLDPATLAQVRSAGLSTTFVPPVIGASGAIAGITGAFLVLFPVVGVRVFVLFFYIGTYVIPAWWFIAFAIAGDIIFGAFSDGRGVAHAAHLGGYAFGAVVALTLLWLKVLPREPFDLFSIGRQAYRRRRFRELATRQSAWTADAGRPMSIPRRKRAAHHDPPHAQTDALAAARLEVASLLTAGRADAACDAYAALLDRDASSMLPADQQLALANHAMASARHQLAAAAYELFLARHPSHQRGPEVRLVLALLNAQYLNDPTRAKEILADLEPAMLSDRDRAFRDQLLDDLG